MPSIETQILRLVLSILVGGIIGAEREYRNKSAGFRTMILISLGSCLFTLFSSYIGFPNNMDRIASNIVTGIGFLGAGVIFKSDDRVKGLTTAATIWMTAALGMGIGAGHYLIPMAGCLMALLVLMVFTFLEGYIDRANQIRTYTIICQFEKDELKKYETLFGEYHLHYKRINKCRNGNELKGSWTVRGKERYHDRFVDRILKDNEVKTFEF